MSRVTGGNPANDLKTVSSVGIVGMGTVGQALGNAFLQRTRSICVWDKVGERSMHSFRDTVSADVVFLCLPTPAGEFGRLNISAVIEVLQRINALGNRRTDSILVLKSTVPVGTTRELARDFSFVNLVHSPEFMDARTSDHDAAYPRLSVIGHTPITPGKTLSVLEKLYVEMWPQIVSNHRTMTSDESETLKLAMNGFFAVKNSFFNGLHALCSKTGMVYSTVAEAMCADGRITETHTRVPGPDGQRGYAGACLPKDSEEYERLLKDHCIGKYQLNNVARHANAR